MPKKDYDVVVVGGGIAISQAELAKFSSLVELLRWRGSHEPDRLGFTFLKDGEKEELSLTYGELHRKAMIIGAWLQSLRLKGERAVLLLPSGLEYLATFFGCLYGGVVTVPIYPPDPSRLQQTMPLFQGVVRDAEPAVILTTTSILSTVQSFLSLFPELNALPWKAIDQIEDEVEKKWRDPGTTANNLALLQYTSGSTGQPKGVMISHANLMHNLSWLYRITGQSAKSQGVQWLPPYQNFGLICGLLGPLYGGFPVVFMSPLSFLQCPVRWLQAISRYRGTISMAPDFAYNLCVQSTSEKDRASLDLSSLEITICGGERISEETVRRFTETFAPYGFRQEAFTPGYGLSEATVAVSVGLKGTPRIIRRLREGGQGVLTCGRPLPDQRTAIVNPKTYTACSEDEIGEIWVSGPSVAPGYWKRPRETEETFRATLKDTGEGPFLRTGDLGFIKEGELFVTGRLKDLIIIRGRNYYPQDIEQTIEHCHPALRPNSGAAFSIEKGGEERMVIVHELEAGTPEVDVPRDLDIILRKIREDVAENCGIPLHAIVLLKAGSLPKTSSGKVQRFLCRSQFLSKKLDVIREWCEPPDTQVASSQVRTGPSSFAREDLEVWLTSILAARLGIPPNEIDPHQPFIRYGLDSLKAMELLSDIEAGLGLRLPLDHLSIVSTVAQLAAQLQSQSLSKKDAS